MTTSAVLVLVLVVALLGFASYYVYGTGSTSSGPGSTSLPTSSSTSATSSTQSSRTSSSTSSGSGFVLPKGASEIIIPPGINQANAQQLGITFEPANLTVVIGVNNTVFFVNQDLSDNLGHVIQSVSWPTGAKPFGAWELLPGWTANVTLTTPGIYHYQCTWHPVWMEGTIVVKA